MAVMQLAADPCHRPGRQRTERLFLASGVISEDTYVLREDVLASTNDGYWRFLKLLVTPLRIRALARDRVLLKLAKDVTDLQAFFKIVVLVRVDQLKILPAVEDDRMVLVVRFAVAKNRV